MQKRVHYHLSDYISHRIAGQANIDALLRSGVAMADDPDDADVIILHDDPLYYPQWVDRYRGRKRIIAYCVWETDILPAPFLRNLRGVDRVWTCSPHSARAFADAGLDRVDVVPHVVNLPPAASSDHAAVRERLGDQGDPFFFYTIVDTVNPRKNLETLLQVFARTFHADRNVRLVVKQYRNAWDLGGLANVISITDTLTPGEMSALHHACHACVSAHHAEAWGLSLSDAMSVGNPVIATGYSGNMFYMDKENSLPVKYTLGPVSKIMCELVPLFTPDMVWADIDQEHMAYCMLKAARGDLDPCLGEKAANAMLRFSPDNVGARMKRILHGLEP